MEKITFTCETITPMFMAGADGQTPELRAPSIKGALRFWWRAMNGHLSLEDTKDENGNVVKGLKSREEEIFGGTEGRSKVVVRVRHDDIVPSLDFKASYKVGTYNGKYKNIDMLMYAAYGHVEYKKDLKKIVLVHSFIPPKTKFDVIFKFLDEEHKVEIIKAFKVLSIYGGLGSKSRNGYGSFQILNPPNKDLPATLVADLFKGDRANYSAFSKDSLGYKVKDEYDSGFKSWGDALGFVTYMYQKARTSIEKLHHYDKRLYIAQPIEVKGEKIDNFLERHSKSIFIKIMVDKGLYYPRVLFMPYNYLGGYDKFNDSQADKLSKYNTFYADFLKVFIDLNQFSKLT